MFVPVPAEPRRLGKARSGEGDRSWSAAPDAGALATGVVQKAGILAELSYSSPVGLVAHFDWDVFAAPVQGYSCGRRSSPDPPKPQPMVTTL